MVAVVDGPMWIGTSVENAKRSGSSILMRAMGRSRRKSESADYGTAAGDCRRRWGGQNDPPVLPPPEPIVERFTISLGRGLARAFDALIAARGYSNRSEAVRDILRARTEQNRLARKRRPDHR